MAPRKSDIQIVPHFLHIQGNLWGWDSRNHIFPCHKRRGSHLDFCCFPYFIDGDFESDLQSDQEEMATTSLMVRLLKRSSRSHFKTRFDFLATKRLKHFFIKHRFQPKLVRTFLSLVNLENVEFW